MGATMDTLTQYDVLNLLNTGHVVAVYPRKKLIVVDGFKRYNATQGAVRAAQTKKGA